MIPVRVRLPLAMLEELAPEGSLDSWVVLVGDREPLRTTSDGRPVYGGIAAWDPVPAPPLGEAEAKALAVRLSKAEFGGIYADEWHWHPVDGDGRALELCAVFDGDEVRMEVAVAPLTALLAEQATHTPTNHPKETM